MLFRSGWEGLQHHDALCCGVELARQLVTTVHRDRVASALQGPQSGIILVDDLDTGVRVVNAYAAEHLEIQTADEMLNTTNGIKR